MRLEVLLVREWWRRIDWVEVALVLATVGCYAGYRVVALLLP